MKRLVFLCFFLMITAPIAAQSGNSSIFRFLETTPNAKAAALGGNHAGLFDADVSLFHLNPAYLTPESSKSVSATFVNYLADVRIGFANGAYDLKNIGTLGIGIRYAGYGDMNEYNENGENLGSFRAGDLAFSTALSTKLSEKLSAAAGVDFIHSSYHTYSSSAITASGGMYYIDRENRFSAGLSFRNLGDQLSYYNGVGEDIPFDVSLGISKKPENFPFQLSLTLRQLNNWNMKVVGETKDPDVFNNIARHAILGGEAAFSDNFKLRLGYNHFVSQQVNSDAALNLAGVSIGVGLNIKGIGIDLSRSSYSDIGGVVQISVRSQLR
jgi:hypothetical protein